MRKLKTSDIPALCRCLKNMGLKDQVQNIAKEADSASDAWARGFDLIWGIFDLATEKKGEKHLYDFLSGPFEMTPEELSDLPLDEFVSGVKEMASENNLSAFFGFAAKSMTSS